MPATQVAEDFASQGFFLAQSPVAGGAIQRQQAGVMRINCIDCLDRTNVVQGVLARKVCGLACRGESHSWAWACCLTAFVGLAQSPGSW